MIYRLFFVFYLWPFFVYSLPFPFLSSFGGAGRAGKGSAEFHVLNSASIIQGASQASGFYFFNPKDTQYGGSISSEMDIPLAVAWVWEPSRRQHRVFSIAGRLNKRWALGAGLHYFSDKTIIPHLGVLLTPFEKLRLGLTGDRVDEKFVYGFGAYFELLKWLNILGDVVYEEEGWTFHGGVEVITQKVFSLRAGQSWPDSAWRIGISFISFPIKVDYTWIQNTGHSFGLRIRSSDF